MKFVLGVDRSYFRNADWGRWNLYYDQTNHNRFLWGYSHEVWASVRRLVEGMPPQRVRDVHRSSMSTPPDEE